MLLGKERVASSFCFLHSPKQPREKALAVSVWKQITWVDLGLSRTGYPVQFSGPGPGPGPAGSKIFGTGSKIFGPGPGTGRNRFQNRVPGPLSDKQLKQKGIWSKTLMNKLSKYKSQ